jgi:hypothetical protein
VIRVTLAVGVLLCIGGWSLSAAGAATGSGLLAYSTGATGAGGGGKVFIARPNGDSPRRIGHPGSLS